MVAEELANLHRSDNQHTQVAQKCATSQADAAALLNVSRRSVQQAAEVNADGVRSARGARGG